MFNTPILFLIFNRPETTAKVFDVIKQVKPAKLFIAADGPRAHRVSDAKLCQQTRELVLNAIDWDCEVKTLFREINFGCGKAVSDAITWFFGEVDEGIILEDDCLPDKSFFSFCEDLLLKYKDEYTIMHIGGHSLGVKQNEYPEGSYFFSAYPHIWGWATWRRAWEFYRFNPADIDYNLLCTNLSWYFKTASEINSWKLVFDNAKKLDTWDYQWTFSLWAHKGLAILPHRNLVRNIGFGPDATHTKNDYNPFDEANYGKLGLLKHPLIRNIAPNHKLDTEMSSSIFNIQVAISPVTGSDSVSHLYDIPVAKIIQLYQQSMNINVSHYFSNIFKLKVFKCNDTDYKFYYPLNIAGDGPFYEHFQHYDWYYSRWKWEHEQAFRFIKPGMKILEVGCGPGEFLKEVARRVPNISVIGLELNQKAIEYAQNNGLHVLPEMIQEHAEMHGETYDLVCSFQVLEHIAEVKSFMEAQIKTLKKGGILIVSVPNNGGFLADSENILNMPPHHMGLWEEKSLRKMGDLFGLYHFDTFFQPLQSYHKSYFQNVIKKRLQKFPKIVRLLATNQLLASLFFSKKYKAFTIQMVWKK